MAEKKKKRKEIENGPVLVFIISLPRTRTEVSFKALTTGILFLPFVVILTILFLEHKLRVTSSLWNMLLSDISNMLISLNVLRILSARFDGPMQPCIVALWVVRGCSNSICKKGIFSKIQMLVKMATIWNDFAGKF